MSLSFEWLECLQHGYLLLVFLYQQVNNCRIFPTLLDNILPIKIVVLVVLNVLVLNQNTVSLHMFFSHYKKSGDVCHAPHPHLLSSFSHRKNVVTSKSMRLTSQSSSLNNHNKWLTVINIQTSKTTPQHIYLYSTFNTSSELSTVSIFSNLLGETSIRMDCLFSKQEIPFLWSIFE